MQVALRPTTTLRPAYGREQPVQLRRPRAVAQRAAHLGHQRDRDQPVRVAREGREPAAGDLLELRARLVRAAQLDQHQRQRRAPGRDRRVELDEPAHGALDLGQAALLAADVEHRLRVVVQGVLGLAALADRQRLLRQALGVVEAAVQLRPGAAEQRGPPQPDRPVDRLRELGGGGDLDVDAVDVAELHQVDDRPARALQLELGVAGLLGHAPQLGGDLEPLLDVLGQPERVVAGVQARRQRPQVADPARDRHGLLGQRQPQLRLARVVELQRHPRQDPGAQRRVLVRQRLHRLVEQRHPLRVRARQRRPRPRHAQRPAREQHGVVELAGGADRRVERRPRLLLEPRALLGRAQRQQQLGPHAIVDRARELARPQRRAVVLRRLLPRQQPIRAPGGGQGEVDRAVGPLDRRRLREVVGEHRQVRIEVAAAQRDQRLAHPPVQPRPPQLRDRVVQRRPHQRVREPVAPDVPDLAQHARLDALVQRLDELVVVLRDDRGQHVVVELAPDHGRDQQHGAGRLGQPPQPPRR